MADRRVVYRLWLGLLVTLAWGGPALPGLGQEGPAIPSVLVLDSTAKNGALSLGGESQLVVQAGDVVVNSSHEMAVFNAGSTIALEQGAMKLVGGLHNLGQAAGAPEPVAAAEVTADPLAAIVYPEVEDVRSRQRMSLSGTDEVTLSPGYYVGGLSLVGKDLKVTMEPGAYAITDGDFFVSEAVLAGKGVTVIMSGRKPGKILWVTGSHVDLSAPTEGTLKDILIVSAAVMQGTNTDVGFNGGTHRLRGTIYAPRGLVGAYFKADVLVGHIVSHNLMLNTGSKVTVMGVAGDDPAWEATAEQ